MMTWLKPYKSLSNAPSPVVVVARARPVPSIVYDTYWQFAAERQEVFFRRLEGADAPWTDDRVLQTYKFTNAYRAADRASQFLIRHVIYAGDQSIEEVFFRIVVFKLFNRIETWESLTRSCGEVSFADYSFDRYDEVLRQERDCGRVIYSAAYVMPSGKSDFGFAEKHRNHLRLIELMMRDGVPQRLATVRSMRAAYELLLSYPMIGPFLAYQLVIDVNYSPIMNFSEMDFVQAGPGARDGLRKCFTTLGDLDESDAIRYVADRQEQEFEKRGLNFRNLWGRRLQLIDCQNLFCEVDKYARVAHPQVKGISGRSRIKQTFCPRTMKFDPWFPPKWGINRSVRGSGKQEKVGEPGDTQALIKAIG